MEKLLKCLMVVILSLAFTSCGEDDKDTPHADSNSIVGTWETMEDGDGALDEPLIYSFDNDGNGYMWYSDEPFSYRSTFTYSASSTRIHIKFNDGDSYDLIYSLSSNGNRLTIMGIDEEGIGELNFTRKE